MYKKKLKKCIKEFKKYKILFRMKIKKKFKKEKNLKKLLLKKKKKKKKNLGFSSSKFVKINSTRLLN